MDRFPPDLLPVRGRDLASLQLEQLLAIPALFQAACQMLSSWYLLSHNESLGAFSDDYFFEEAVKAPDRPSARDSRK